MTRQLGHPPILDDTPSMEEQFGEASMREGDGVEEQFGELHAIIDELLTALTEAELQIIYLHDKFKETGSGNAVLARIRAAILSATKE